MNGTDAICIGRSILYRQSGAFVSPELEAHEMVHQRQMDRHGVVRFYLIYLLEYLAHRIRLGDHSRAYRAVTFEVEAYAS